MPKQRCSNVHMVCACDTNKRCAEKREKHKRQPPSPYIKLSQATKSIMDNEWSSMYTVMHSKKEFLKQDLIF